ncbi:MAG: FGGY-family carbohydrate kinase [Bacillota bacterium]|nr:FGGY-family carbohydrate kinase [Bacillota bacterium]
MDCLLSIDIGLTQLKCVLFSLTGREIHIATAHTLVLVDKGRSEIDMDELWAKTASLIRLTLTQSGTNPADIAAVGCCGHGAGLYLADQQLQPVRRAITSMDNRAETLLEQCRTQGSGDRTCLFQQLWAGQALPLLAWLQIHEPEAIRKAAWILSAKDWIIARLTGRAGMDMTDGSNNGLIRSADKLVAVDLMDELGLADCVSKLPPLRQSTALAGTVQPASAAQTGLLPGTPVAGGLFDCAACALGCGLLSGNSYSLIAGTWNINAGIDTRLLGPSESTKCTLFPDGVHYFYVESSSTSAVNLDWFVRQILQGNGDTDQLAYQRINDLVATAYAVPNDLMYLPFLYPAGMLRHQQGASLINLRPEHTRGDVLAAIYRGVTYAHRLHLDRLRASGIVRSSAVLTGGAAKSDIWRQIFADTLGLSVITAEASQTGALGAAMCAAVAIGQWEDLPTADAQMVRRLAVFQPDPEVSAESERQYRLFLQYMRLLDQPFDR